MGPAKQAAPAPSGKSIKDALVPTAVAADAAGAAASTEPAAAGAAASSGPSLYDKATDGKDSGPRRRTLTRKSTDEFVEKSLYDNFRSFSSTEVDGNVVAGRTLRQRLLEDKRKNRDAPKAHPMGHKYYRELREEYASHETAVKRLVVQDPSQVVNAGLLKAMIQVQQGKHANKGALVGWMSTCNSLNQKELTYLQPPFLQHFT